MKKHIDRVDIRAVKRDVDFKVVTDTEFNDSIEYVYAYGYDIDLVLAVSLGLGAIEALADGELFLYNAQLMDSEDNEAFRFGIYYQITNPEYVDVKLDIILNQTKGGEEYIRSLLVRDVDNVVQRLKDVIQSQKGGEDNIIPFKK